MVCADSEKNSIIDVLYGSNPLVNYNKGSTLGSSLMPLLVIVELSIPHCQDPG